MQNCEINHGHDNDHIPGWKVPQICSCIFIYSAFRALERLARGFISRFRVGDANNIMGIIPYSYENDSAYLLEYVYSAIAVLKRKAYLGVLYKSWTIY